jgi:hypothetical protein
MIYKQKVNNNIIVEERIKETKTFSTTIDSDRYKCYIKSESDNDFNRVKHVLYISKLKKLKFLWWEYFLNIIDWSTEYYIGFNDYYLEGNVDCTYLNGYFYYSIDGIKEKIVEAVKYHTSTINIKKEEKAKLKNIKHKREI